MTPPKLTVKIDMLCPVCKKFQILNVDKVRVNRSNRGLTAIKVQQDVMCQHSFIAYVDNNFLVRDAYVCDFKIDIPEIEIQETENNEKPIDFDVDIIKINIIPSLMINIFKGIIMGQKIVVLSSNKHIATQFTKFFAYIMRNNIDYTIECITNEVYKKNKKSYKDNIVLEGNKILKDNGKVLANKELRIVSSIIPSFYAEFDSVSSLIILKNEIDKITAISKEIIAYNRKLKDGKKFSSKSAIDHLRGIYSVKIPLPYFKFLLEIVEQSFNVHINKNRKSSDFLDFL